MALKPQLLRDAVIKHKMKANHALFYSVLLFLITLQVSGLPKLYHDHTISRQRSKSNNQKYCQITFKGIQHLNWTSWSGTNDCAIPIRSATPTVNSKCWWRAVIAVQLSENKACPPVNQNTCRSLCLAKTEQDTTYNSTKRSPSSNRCTNFIYI